MLFILILDQNKQISVLKVSDMVRLVVGAEGGGVHRSDKGKT